MADVAITLTTLTVNTRSGDLVGGGASVTAGQTFSIAANNKTDDLIIALEEQNSGAATVTFDAGDDPPSKREGLGALAIVLAQADLRLLQLEGGRFIQSDGTILGSVATNTVKIFAFRTSRLW
jgi:hypothetical protein